MAGSIDAAGETPLISVAMPVYDPAERHLYAAIESVLAQRYQGWELCVVDDGSTRPGVRELLARYAARHPRIELQRSDSNSGISAATNRASAMCRGEYVAFLDHDDALAPDALGEVARAIEADPALDVVYTDQDKLTPRGRRRAPFHKPDWSPVYALGAMYIGHLLVVRRGLVAEVGGLDSAFDGIQDFQLFMRISERTDRIRHLPRILYHWRAVPGSVAAGVDEKSGIPELQARDDGAPAAAGRRRHRGAPPGDPAPHPARAGARRRAPRGQRDRSRRRW